MISDLERTADDDAIRRAQEYGVDISLLVENRKLTPTERIQKARLVIESILALQSQVRKFRLKQGAV